MRGDELLDCSDDGTEKRIDGTGSVAVFVRERKKNSSNSQSRRDTSNSLLDFLRRGFPNHSIFGKVVLLTRQVCFAHPRVVLI